MTPREEAKVILGDKKWLPEVEWAIEWTGA